MKIARQETISRRIVTHDDVIRLGRIFADEFSSRSSVSSNARLTFTVRADDGTVFETDNIGDLSSDQVLRTKRIVSFDLSLSDYSNDLRMHLSISHGASDYRNSISVEGTDANWVNGSFTRLKDNIEACSPQNSFIVRHRLPIEFVTALGIGRLYVWALDIFLALFFPSFNVSNPPEWITSLAVFFRAHPTLFISIDYIIGLPAGWFPASILLDKASRLWPSVELQIGPPHTYTEKRRRLLLLTIFMTGILPLITSFIYDLLRSKP